VHLAKLLEGSHTSVPRQPVCVGAIPNDLSAAEAGLELGRLEYEAIPQSSSWIGRWAKHNVITVAADRVSGI
jgi:hypothetical protein